MSLSAPPALPTLPLGLPGWTLRTWREGDAPALAEHANNPAVWRTMSDRFPHPYTLEIASHWVQRGHVDFGGDNWAIAIDDLAVGGCGVHLGEGPLACNAEIGYWLAQLHWGRGVTTQVARVLTEQAFAQPQVTRVFAPVHAGNAASMRVLLKNGFVCEGTQRFGAIKAARVVDLVVHAKYREGA